MSEYQYYEFQAIDRPLTAKEMEELRRYSTRARITPTCFTNHYEWGSFKGNEDGWMERYFDAFLYLANWGTRILQFRLPTEVLDADTAGTYCYGEGASARKKGGKTILRFLSEDDSGDDDPEGAGHLGSLIAAREGLMKGDLRALYLGWLLLVQGEELDEDELEPPVPPGLAELSGALQGMASFLRIDPDLIDAAAAGSAPLRVPEVDRKSVRAWVQLLPTEEKDRMLADLVLKPDLGPILALQARMARGGSMETRLGLEGTRTVAELRELAQACATDRRRLEQEKRSMMLAIREQEAAIAREAHLDRLKGQEPGLWDQVEALADSKLPKSYDRAVALLVDLRDMGFRSRAFDFANRIEAFRTRHAHQPSLMKRLDKAGL
jgi:hypothetical protein